MPEILDVPALAGKLRPKKAYLFPTALCPQPLLTRAYDAGFRPDAAYLDSLPDMTETVGSVAGANVAIQQVGVSGFRLPLRFRTRDGDALTLEARVSGTVSLEADLKGINMSRIIRSFYARAGQDFTPDTLLDIAQAYREEVGGLHARLKVGFQFPMLVPSLRSELAGYQYYAVSFEAALAPDGVGQRFMELDFVYSSACPCSAELAEHARDVRGVYAVPHSQRSRARVKVELREGCTLSVEELVEHLRIALQTETQVMVKREDEQAFAELNGAHPKFVEDAARLVYAELNRDARIRDFSVACAHLESLHSHDAVSVIVKGVPGGLRADFMDFGQLAG